MNFVPRSVVLLFLSTILQGAAPAQDTRAASRPAGEGARLIEPTRAPEGGPCRLVVFISVDQLARHVYRAAHPFFGTGGFRRLEREGTSFRRAAYAHAGTLTGPGHATLATGAPPCLHGIVSNSWTDPATGRPIYCVADPKAAPLEGWEEGAGVGPGNLLAPTLGDTMKVFLSPAARVVSLSFKDRAAILLGGHAADLAVWYSPLTGRFVTNRYYVSEKPAWLEAFDRSRRVDAFFGRRWKHFAPHAAYAMLTDERPFERPSGNGSRSVGHAVTGGEKEPGPRYHQELPGTPFANELLLELTFRALEEEGLGRDAIPDLLALSFSAGDYAGHAHGPLSVEVRDVTLRLDALLARLLARLDEKVGKGRYLVVLSADHGVAPAPAWTRDLRAGGGQDWMGRKARQAAEEALRAAFGPAPDDASWVHASSPSSLHLRADLIRASGHELVEAQDIAARAALRAPGIGAAIGRERALRHQIPDTPVHRALALMVHPLRSADVIMAPRPFWIPPGIVASHGSPHAHDRFVPLLVMGPGIRAGRVSETSVTPAAGVVLVAEVLGIPVPALCFEPLPLGVLADS